MSGDLKLFLQAGQVVASLGTFDYHVIDIGLYNIPNQFMKDSIHYPLTSCPDIFQNERHGRIVIVPKSVINGVFS